jgi:hypothetical protein
MLSLEVEANDDWLWSVQLRRLAADDEDDRAITLELLEAIDALAAGWLEPLVASFTVNCCNPDNFFEPSPEGLAVRPNWSLVAAELPANVKAPHVGGDAVQECIARLDRAALQAYLERALDQRCPVVGHVTSLGSLTWTAVRARLPVRAQLVLRHGTHTLAPGTEQRNDGEWVSRPGLSAVGHPAQILAYNEHYAASITLSILWDLWFRHPAGRALVDAGIARVLARGRGWNIERQTGA